MRSRWALGIAVGGALALTACPEWLEVDDGEEQVAVAAGTPVVLPSAPPTASGEGPFVPQTPGLKVPLAGYWTRARLDSLDVIFPYTWVSVVEGEQRLILRLEATHGQTDAGYGLGPSFRAVVPVALPPGTDRSVLKDGFVLTADSLHASVVALRTSSQDLWQVELERLELVAVTPRLMVGAIEGEARRGAKGQRGRRLIANFIALSADGPMPRRLVP
jgi:hypothetical protein